MNSKWSVCVFCLAALSVMSLFAIGELKDAATGEQFPAEITVSHQGKNYDLEATGVATRKKLIVKVYSIASYLQKGAQGSDPLAKIMSSENAKQLTIKWVRDVPVSKVVETYRESFKTVLEGSQGMDINKDIETYLSFFTQDAAKGGELVLRWFPKGYVEVLIDGKTAGTITSEPFAKALWSIWFGKKSVVNVDQLLSNMKS